MNQAMPERQFRLTDALNTYDHALKAIFAKHYRSYLVPAERDAYLGAWQGLSAGGTSPRNSYAP